MEHDSQPEAYCVHVWIRGIHPMLCRRFLVRSDGTLADLRVVLQIGFDWTDFHLHRFRIRKKDYAVPSRGGLGCCHDARKIKLGDLHFRINKRFLYEYDFGDLWQHQVRIEKRLEIETSRGGTGGRKVANYRWVSARLGYAASAGPTVNRRIRRWLHPRQGPKVPWRGLVRSDRGQEHARGGGCEMLCLRADLRDKAETAVI